MNWFWMQLLCYPKSLDLPHTPYLHSPPDGFAALAENRYLERWDQAFSSLCENDSIPILILFLILESPRNLSTRFQGLQSPALHHPDGDALPRLFNAFRDDSFRHKAVTGNPHVRLLHRDC